MCVHVRFLFSIFYFTLRNLYVAHLEFSNKSHQDYTKMISIDFGLDPSLSWENTYARYSLNFFTLPSNNSERWFYYNIYWRCMYLFIIITSFNLGCMSYWFLTLDYIVIQLFKLRTLVIFPPFPRVLENGRIYLRLDSVQATGRYLGGPTLDIVDKD